MEDFQIEIPEFEIPEIDILEGDFCDVEIEMDYELEMEDDNGEGVEDEESETKRPPRPKAANPKHHIQYKRQMQQNRQGPRKVQVKVKDNLRCSVFTTTFCNCLFLGTAALICSLKARSKMNQGDMVKAQEYSRRACRTNTVAVIVTGVALTVFLVFYLGGVCNNGVIFHSLTGVSSASSSDTSFDIERQKSKPRKYYDQSRHNSYPSLSNINRSPQRPSYRGGRLKG